MPDFLIYEQDGPLVTLTMNQPEQRNPLSGNTAIEDMIAACDRINADRAVRCVILTGNGPSFSAGGDIREMKRQATTEVTELDIRHEYRRIQRMTLSLFNLEVPVIAAINGAAIGAGLALACMCDIRIASEKAKFADSYVKLGIIPGNGGAWLLPRIVGPARAAELSLTGDMIDAHEALSCQLVSRVVPPQELLPTARALAARITQNAPHAVRLTKRLMREALRAPLDTTLELAAAFQAIAHKTPDHSEAVNAFLEKRTPNFASSPSPSGRGSG
jgi:enoyl-CoA hydratase/carnithine racemase